MIHRIDARLREEAARFRLVFSCDACAAFEPDDASCAFGFPTEPHRDANLEGRDEVVFCKTFELV